MEVHRDTVEIFVLPDSAKCLADTENRNPKQITICPIENLDCSGDCQYYSEE